MWLEIIMFRTAASLSSQTWLYTHIPDATVQLAERMLYDRTGTVIPGRTEEGGSASTCMKVGVTTVTDTVLLIWSS